MALARRVRPPRVSKGRRPGAPAPRARSKAPRPVTQPTTPPTTPRPPFTVFLDRDGVLNRHPRIQVRRWARFEWLPGAKAAMARLNRPDVQIVLVTNQPATGLGWSRVRTIERLHARMLEDLREAGGRIDRVEVCYAALPNRRRKPRPGMLEDAAAALAKDRGFDQARAIMVGDKPKDGQAAHAFGVPCILLATTHSAPMLAKRAAAVGVAPLSIEPGLPEAVAAILERVEAT